MIYIGEKKEKKRRWDTHWGAGEKRIRRIILRGGHKEQKREIAAKVPPGTLPIIFLLFWYSRLHSFEILWLFSRSCSY